MVTKLFADNLPGGSRPEWRQDATARYLAGALVELLAWWIDSRPLRSIDDIEALFLRLAEPVVREAMSA
jgi:hypothetical protein